MRKTSIPVLIFLLWTVQAGAQFVGPGGTIPAVAEDVSLPKFLYKTMFGMPAQAGRVAVVVEEPATGLWGGVVSTGAESTSGQGGAPGDGR